MVPLCQLQTIFHCYSYTAYKDESNSKIYGLVRVSYRARCTTWNYLLSLKQTQFFFLLMSGYMYVDIGCKYFKRLKGFICDNSVPPRAVRCCPLKCFMHLQGKCIDILLM